MISPPKRWHLWTGLVASSYIREKTLSLNWSLLQIHLLSKPNIFPLFNRDGIFKLSRNPGIDSASLCRLLGLYANPIPTGFLAPIDCYTIRAGVTEQLISVIVLEDFSFWKFAVDSPDFQFLWYHSEKYHWLRLLTFLFLYIYLRSHVKCRISGQI